MPATSPFPLPITVEEITPEWLTRALRGFALEAFVHDVAIVGEIRGTCTKLRLRLDLNDAARAAGIPEIVILKGGFEGHSRANAQMHEREVRGFKDVLPALGLPAPASYFAEYDADRAQGIIIMEDLLVRGVTICHASRPHSFEQVARRLTALARFHAQTWSSAELEPGGRWGDLVDFFETMQYFFDLKTIPETWNRFVVSPRGAACSVRFHDRDWMIGSWEALKRFCATLPHCVLHGDIHLGNLYIEPDGSPGFFDTLASRGPGMLEVSYHISASIDSADRPRWEGPLVQHYLNELRTNGVAAPDFDEAMRQYAITLIYGHFIWMTTESQYQTEAVNTANMARVNNAMLEHRTKEIVATLP